jgi:hypothetical protein
LEGFEAANKESLLSVLKNQKRDSSLISDSGASTGFSPRSRILRCRTTLSAVLSSVRVVEPDAVFSRQDTTRYRVAKGLSLLRTRCRGQAMVTRATIHGLDLSRAGCVQDAFIGFRRDHPCRWRRSILVLPTAWRKDSSFCWYRIGTTCRRRVLRCRSAEFYVDAVGRDRTYGRTLVATLRTT